MTDTSPAIDRRYRELLLQRSGADRVKMGGSMFATARWISIASLVVLLLSLGQFAGPIMLGRQQRLDVVTTEMYLMTREFPVNYALGAAYGVPLLVLAVLCKAFTREDCMLLPKGEKIARLLKL